MTKGYNNLKFVCQNNTACKHTKPKQTDLQKQYRQKVNHGGMSVVVVVVFLIEHPWNIQKT